MIKLIPSKQVRYLAVIFAIVTSLFVLASGSAQPTQALNEDWRATDYNFTARMMDTDWNDNVVILGDTVVGDYLDQEIQRRAPPGKPRRSCRAAARCGSQG
jgi:hypothetical protein